MAGKDWIELAMVVIMLVGLIGGFWNRHRLHKGIGVRFIQFLGVVFVVPVIVILTLEQRLGTDPTATLLGTIVGYLLSGIGKDEKPSEKLTKPDK